MTGTWTLAPGVLRLRDDRLAGGAPFRVVRLSATGSTGLAALLGTAATPSPTLAPLTEKLVRYGLLLAPGVDTEPDDVPPTDVTVVIPALSEPGPVQRLLDAVPAGVPVVVVDDGSPRPLQDALIGPLLTVIRHATPRGPAAARNTGAARVTTGWIAFVDADVEPGPGWLTRLLGVARADPEVVAVGPRVRSARTPGLGGTVEHHAGGLDLGPVAADVAPGGPVGYLPTALLLVDRAAFERAGGFDEAMAVAEDVDLVWRLGHEGVIRYVPSVVVWHAPRATVRQVLGRRRFYGSGAALLEQRHPGVVRHADVSVWSFVPAALALVGFPRTALAVAAGSVAAAPRALSSLPAADAARLALHGHGLAAVTLGRFALRPWWPALLTFAVVAPRRRRAVAVTVALGTVDIVRRARRDDGVRPTDLPAVVGSRLLDDLAYSLGVFEGVFRTRRAGPLLPRIRLRTRA